VSPTRAQNAVRRQYGIGKGKLHKRMSKSQTELNTRVWDARWRGEVRQSNKCRMHALVDAIAADSIIAAAYREAEREEEEIDINSPLGATP